MMMMMMMMRSTTAMLITALLSLAVDTSQAAAKSEATDGGKGGAISSPPTSAYLADHLISIPVLITVTCRGLSDADHRTLSEMNFTAWTLESSYNYVHDKGAGASGGGGGISSYGHLANSRWEPGAQQVRSHYLRNTFVAAYTAEWVCGQCGGDDDALGDDELVVGETELSSGFQRKHPSEESWAAKFVEGLASSPYPTLSGIRDCAMAMRGNYCDEEEEELNQDYETS